MILTVRPMLKDDVDDVHAIDNLSFSLPWPKSSFIAELSNPISLCRVAEVTVPNGNYRIVGALVLWVIIDEAHVATIAVLPEYRRMGIARRLLAEGLKECILLGVQEATLEVRVNNQAAIMLYERFGFEVMGIRPRYYADNHEDALIMTSVFLDESLLNGIIRESME